jgi:CO/xanthine dehydrogenase FAD-binding subunit
VRSDLADFELVVPGTLDDALRAIAAEPGVWRALAGGTDVMVLLSAGKLAHRRWIDVWGLDDLRGIDVTTDTITMGALTTYTDVVRHEVVSRELSMLAQAARETGGVAIQNRGTLGGNIANASPAADSPPALLAYGASVELASVRGRRWVDYATFHTGYKRTVMAADELITRIRMPRAAGERVHYYKKVGPRRAQAISKVCFAACADLDGSRVRAVRIAVGGVAPVVVTCDRLDRDAVARVVAPIDDVRSTARYRRRVADNLFSDFAAALPAGATGAERPS